MKFFIFYGSRFEVQGIKVKSLRFMTRGSRLKINDSSFKIELFIFKIPFSGICSSWNTIKEIEIKI